MVMIHLLTGKSSVFGLGENFGKKKFVVHLLSWLVIDKLRF